MPSSCRVLVVRFSSLGDVVLTTPLLRALNRAWPGAEITVATKALYAPLLQHHPHVARVESLAPTEPLRALARRLGTTRYDYCLDLHGSLRALALRRLVPGPWTGYRKRRLARAALIHLKMPATQPVVPVAERYFDAVRALGITPDGGPAEVVPSAADRETAARIAPTGCVVLAPGAAHATKRWPAEHWQDLARRLLAQGHQVLGIGGAGDRARLPGPDVIEAYGHSLGVAAALLARSRVVVANDSGLMHLATAVGRPVVTLVGPTVEAFGFFPYHASATVLQQTLPCRPCSAHGGPRCPEGHHRCLIDIRPAWVAAAVEAAA